MEQIAKIPKIIHCIWLGGKMPDINEKYIKNWQKMCPEYEIKFWNEENFDFSSCQYAQEAYKAKKYAYVSDYIRTKVLDEYGGIYLDTDVEVVKNFDTLLNEDFFLSFENEAYLEAAVIGTIPHHPFIKKMIEFYENAHFVDKNGNLNTIPNTILFTILMSKYCHLKQNNTEQILEYEGKKLHIYEMHAFAPKNYITKTTTIKDYTYTIHHFDASWFNKKMKIREKLVRFIYKITFKKIFAIYIRCHVKTVSKSLKRKYRLSKKST